MIGPIEKPATEADTHIGAPNEPTRRKTITILKRKKKRRYSE